MGVATATVLMRSNANKSEDRLFVRAGNTDFMSGTPFEQSSWCGPAFPIFQKLARMRITAMAAVLSFIESI